MAKLHQLIINQVSQSSTQAKFFGPLHGDNFVTLLETWWKNLPQPARKPSQSLANPRKPSHFRIYEGLRFFMLAHLKYLH